jgi:CubicO group peptidase (beta-lactamase class C family)
MAEGTVAPGYEGVRAAFERCFAELGETGASFHALAGGAVVADLWGGAGFARDTLVHVYSVTKPVAAFCVLVLADRGALGLDDRVAAHWPEFAAAGKQDVTVRQLLAHQAGLVALREPQPPEVLLDWERLVGLLAAEAPWFEPGSAHAEHALFYGHLCGELVRRVDGRTLGTFWREEVAGPWRLDFHVGLDSPELARVADLAGAFPASEGGELYRAGLDNPPGARDLAVVNGEAWRRAEIPAINGHGTAAGVARFFEGLRRGGELDGVRLVGPEMVAAMSAGELRAHDALIGDEMCWGLGVWVDVDGYGMGGTGGSLGMTDPALGLSEGYVTRQMGTHDRADAMDAALREAIG